MFVLRACEICGLAGTISTVVSDLARRKRSILFCHYASDPLGGSDFALVDLVSNLPTERFDSTVVLRKGDPLAGRYREGGITTLELGFHPPTRVRRAGPQSIFLLSFLPEVLRLARMIREVNPDLVHVNTMYNIHAILAAKIALKPLVCHVREISGSIFFDSALPALVRMCAWRVVAISTAVRQLLGDGDRVRLIHDGVDLGPFSLPVDRQAVRARVGVCMEAKVIAIVGRIEPRRGQATVIGSVPAILERFPSAYFLFVGAPATHRRGYGDELKRRCVEIGIQDRVKFLEFRSDVPDILAISDLSIVASTTPEPFGRVVVESMAAGCPVIASAEGGPADILEHGRTGWLIPPNDSEALAAAVIHALSSPPELSAMIEDAAHRAREAFGLDRHVEQMARLFAEPLSIF